MQQKSPETRNANNERKCSTYKEVKVSKDWTREERRWVLEERRPWFKKLVSGAAPGSVRTHERSEETERLRWRNSKKGFGETHSHRVGGGGEVTDSFCFCSLLLLFFSVTFSVLCAHLRAPSNQMILNWKVYYRWIANSQGSSRVVHVRELNAPNGSVLFMGFSNQSLLRSAYGLREVKAHFIINQSL